MKLFVAHSIMALAPINFHNKVDWWILTNHKSWMNCEILFKNISKAAFKRGSFPLKTDIYKLFLFICIHNKLTENADSNVGSALEDKKFYKLQPK